MKTYKKLYGALCLLAVSATGFSQSNPTPFNLNASGNYAFSAWSASSASGTYPSSMIFHLLNTTYPSVNAMAQSDLLVGYSYNYSSGTRIQGLGSSGLLFQNASSPVNTGFTANKVGEAVLGLVTTGRTQVHLQWKAQTRSTTGGQTALRAQYRIGTSGAYQDFPVSAEYMASTTLNDSASFSLYLPPAAENQPVVQVRWIYYNVSGTPSVSQAIRLDDIAVHSIPIVTLSQHPDVCVNASAFTLTDGSPAGGTYTGTGVVNGNMFDPSVSGAGTFLVTYTYTDPNGISNSASINMVVSTGACVIPVGLAANSCGATGLLKNSYIYTETAPDAQDYEYEFSGGDLVSTIVVRRNSWFTDFNLSWVSALNYGQTYNVRVRAKVDGIWGVFANTCTISLTATPPTPHLQASYCGATGLSLTSWIQTVPISGAQYFEYRFINIATNDTVTRVTANGYTTFNLSWVPQLQYASTYNVDIRAKINGVWGDFGSVCQVSTMAFPTTQLTSTSCGATNLSLSDRIYIDPVSGATNYQYKFTPMPSGTPIYKYRNSGSTDYLLSWAGLQSNTTYSVEVRAYAGGWGSYGSACEISTGSSARLGAPDENTDAPDASTGFTATLYPNPVSNGVTPSIAVTGASGSTAIVRIMDATGKEVSNYALQVEGEAYKTTLSNFPALAPGMYFMSVSVNDSVHTTRFIVQ